MKLLGWLMRRLLPVVTALLAACVPSGRDLPPLQTVPEVDLERYVGTWYEVARFPHSFQRDCMATRAVYTLRDDGQIGVYNECRRESLDGPVRSVNGRARVVDVTSNAKLEVTFFWPFWGDYWIIDLDPGYRWAVVGHPSRKYLWILSRERHLDGAVLATIEARLRGQGYDLERLIRTVQPE